MRTGIVSILGLCSAVGQPASQLVVGRTRDWPPDQPSDQHKGLIYGPLELLSANFRREFVVLLLLSTSFWPAAAENCASFVVVVVLSLNPAFFASRTSLFLRATTID